MKYIIIVMVCSFFLLAGCNQGNEIAESTPHNDNEKPEPLNELTIENETPISTRDLATEANSESDNERIEMIVKESELEERELEDFAQASAPNQESQADELSEEQSPTGNENDPSNEETKEAPVSLLAQGIKDFELEIEFTGDQGELEIEYEGKKKNPKAKIKEERGSKGKGKEKGKKKEVEGKEAVQYIEAFLDEIYLSSGTVDDATVDDILAYLDLKKESIKKFELEIEFQDKTKVKYEQK
ncbi:YusW family protein [Alkalihalophilus lindianensis]|uniref:YusW family protein n=1 Tax=Alkalihalophilus lindianensis TaxID=1630542 RepID=A0ABU3X779_9BACI|nr:YusW family protein [Alkalihalophilus lindianensis]MDV2683749.1 YusW family protein [Alkalihalophilus lindianensis]